MRKNHASSPFASIFLLFIFLMCFYSTFFVIFRTKTQEMYRAKGQLPPSAPPTLAAAAVLRQTGLWGRLMGGPDAVKKAAPEETESTDGEDEVRRMCNMYSWD